MGAVKYLKIPFQSKLAQLYFSFLITIMVRIRALNIDAVWVWLVFGSLTNQSIC